MLVGLHREPSPLIELLVDERAGRDRLEPERMAAEIDQRITAPIGGKREAGPKCPERIACVALACRREGVLAAHDRGSVTAYSRGRLGTASPASAGTCSSRR